MRPSLSKCSNETGADFCADRIKWSEVQGSGEEEQLQASSNFFAPKALEIGGSKNRLEVAVGPHRCTTGSDDKVIVAIQSIAEHSAHLEKNIQGIAEY